MASVAVADPKPVRGWTKGGDQLPADTQCSVKFALRTSVRPVPMRFDGGAKTPGLALELFWFSLRSRSLSNGSPLSGSKFRAVGRAVKCCRED